MGSSTAATAAVLLYVAVSMVAAAASAEPQPRYISMAALKGGGTEPASSSSRKLIGRLRTGICPVPFDEMRRMGNIESKCKGQEVPKPHCCKAFKDFACPYSDLLDDFTTGCSGAMLIKLQTFCSVPMGYFGFCGDSAMGITCPPR
uniref:Uncharacterized protein n=1 Tax=Avena sativa TaxID=4498 RepID=A0ACD5USY7_AVESA